MSAGMADRLRRAAAQLDGETVPMHQLMALHGPSGQGTMMMMLAVPCLLPVAGVGTVLGMGIIALAVAMWRGQHASTLPGRVASFEMPRAWAQRVLNVLAGFYAVAGRLARERLTHLVDRGQGGWMALKVLLMALVIILPLPLGNVLPAIALVLLGLGLLFRDGLAILLAAAAALAALAYTVVLAWLVWHFGVETVLGWFGF